MVPDLKAAQHAGVANDLVVRAARPELQTLKFCVSKWNWDSVFPKLPLLIFARHLVEAFLFLPTYSSIRVLAECSAYFTRVDYSSGDCRTSKFSFARLQLGCSTMSAEAVNRSLLSLSLRWSVWHMLVLVSTDRHSLCEVACLKRVCVTKSPRGSCRVQCTSSVGAFQI